MARGETLALTTGAEDYSNWRSHEMVRTWAHFSREAVDDKDVLDFGCGEGPLSLYLASVAAPRSIVGVDLYARDIARAQAALTRCSKASLVCQPTFRAGEPKRIPVPDESIDIVVAMDCMEHVMDPLAIMMEWRRVLRSGGRVLLAWSPFKGPWGAHMQTLVPVPWAHVLFGERAVCEAAERMYDDPAYIPRHWDYDERGALKPNKFRVTRRFQDGGYLNELDIAEFSRLAARASLTIARLDAQPFGSGGLKRLIGRFLLKLPIIRSYCTSFVIAELVRAPTI